MPDPYLVLKWLHVAGACIAFGSNVTHVFWLVAANRDPVHRARILRLVKTIDDRLAVPAWVVTLGCGATMWLWRWPTDASWIVASLALSLVLAAMGVAYGPLMLRWIRIAETRAPDDPAQARLARGLTGWWAVIVANVFVVLYLMIWKPVLW